MAEQDYAQSFFGVDIGAVDPDIDAIIGFEEERQARKLIMIPSESIAPKAVREALGSVFNNVYAEGYPPLRMTRDDEETLLDVPHQLAYYRRYADRRFYKGVDYVHFIETLAQRRAAACFANERVSAKDIYVNVQPLSGAAANLVAYDTLVPLGETVMGMDLYQGGHLTHGSEFNFSGKRYHVVSYGVNPATGKLDYDQIRDLAKTHRPKMIIAGFTSYSWAPDWEAFAAIAHEVGAALLADISHPAGMVIAGAFPSPVGLADVITFTTHKTLCGPRGACIMTTNEDLAARIDAGVFPGEQGGPHTQKFAAMAVAFNIARTEPFRRLQWRIKENATALAGSFRKRGVPLAYGGTDSHIVVLDLGGIKTTTGWPLRAEPVVRILDLAGIVANKNTIPGDRITALASGVRLGTPWLSQRGFGPAEMDRVADAITRIVTNVQPFSYTGLAGELPRGKLALEIFESVKADVAELAAQGAAETGNPGSEYPHYYRLQGPASAGQGATFPKIRAQSGPGMAAELEATRTGAALIDLSACGLLQVVGDRAMPSLAETFTNDVGALAPGGCGFGFALDADGQVIDDVCVMRQPVDEDGRDRYIVRTQPENHERVKAWLRELGDGYTLFDRRDILAKVEGPIIVADLSAPPASGAPMPSQAAGEGEIPTAFVALALDGPRAAQLVDGGARLPAGVQLFRRGQDHVEIVAPAAAAQEAYDACAAAGAIPAGAGTLKALREAAGLPDYSACPGYGPDSGRPTGLDLWQRSGLRGAAPGAGPLVAMRERFELRKPYFVGQGALEPARAHRELPAFSWSEPENAPLLRTPLYAWHKAHTHHIVPFAGWEMPVWYTGVLDEHNAVRKAAGLFDVAHMGVLEVSGPHAAEFLDLAVSNYTRWFGPGESFYSYLLDADGHVIDDLIVYHKRPDVYQIVVNASNADKDWTWLNAVNNDEVLLDRAHPEIRVLRPARLRNLKDPSCGADRRIDLALQGPAGMAILQSLADPATADRVGRLRRTGVMECVLGAPIGEHFDLVISRTGYTGEDIGYELFVHPERALAFWEALLAAGKPFGLQPCGLAARDSTRTEAGLPLYGHELAGPFDISPAGAGFAAYVKLHKPYFVGRAAHVAREKTRTMEIARFRMNDRGVRMPKTGDPVVNRKGQAIGWVTSAAVDVDGIIIGLAYVQSRAARPDDAVGIFSLGGKSPAEKSSKAELTPGDKVALPDPATLLTRFPLPAERAHWREVGNRE